jgi:hypothetical protein
MYLLLEFLGQSSVAWWRAGIVKGIYNGIARRHV